MPQASGRDVADEDEAGKFQSDNGVLGDGNGVTGVDVQKGR
jgi:hypothetical protein